MGCWFEAHVQCRTPPAESLCCVFEQDRLSPANSTGSTTGKCPDSGMTEKLLAGK